ncbi:Na-translocating system protein MpsC family protein [Evansella sp. AB-P1]|uniref:Na-translocating system protein MpsC family protein n=1 Tax=Evansella sp. AB-P1 TaxID=3037653 RepID=UPI00241F5C99|nr:Na-translocating system protein MpsC family protein [Evansella sp. AB-P1]MDG5787480.1 Na-translocating system protein MpsC family protein [Evansella sp. AB-P1]
MIKQKRSQENLIYLSSQLSKILKKSFGKGPDSCYCTLREQIVFFHIRQFKTPAEEVLLQKGETNLATKLRKTIMDAIFEQFKQELDKILDIEFESFLQDWNFETNTGLVIFISKVSESNNDITSQLNQTKNEILEDQIAIVYSEVYKAPRHVRTFEVTETICVLECTNVISPLEIQLYKKGMEYSDVLLSHSNDLKKSIRSNRERFSSGFNLKIYDVFIFLDYKTSKNYVVFYLK